MVLCLPEHKKRAPKEQREKRLCDNKEKFFGAKMNNKWERQFIDHRRWSEKMSPQ